VEAINQETWKAVQGLFGEIMRATGILNEVTVSQTLKELSRRKWDQPDRQHERYPLDDRNFEDRGYLMSSTAAFQTSIFRH